eukprot:scaffold16.g90.t1
MPTSPEPRCAAGASRLNRTAGQRRKTAKYVGTGHADTNRFEWNLNIKRDTYASLIGHHSLTAYHAIAENEAIGRMRYEFLQRMLLPCGVPPEREDE